jgi:hypothetical protein
VRNRLCRGRRAEVDVPDVFLSAGRNKGRRRSISGGGLQAGARAKRRESEMTARLDVNDVQRIRDLLKRAPEPIRTLSRAQAVQALVPEIRKLRAKGYSVEQLAAMLHEHGFRFRWPRSGGT